MLNETHIEFGMNVSTNGWISIGISPNGNMINSDIIFSWIDGDTVHLQNRYTSDQLEAPKILQNQNNIQLIEGQQNENFTQIRFIRTVHPCDMYSRPIIKNGPTKIIFAFGEHNPVNIIRF